MEEPAHILVVDDDRDIRMLVAEHLEAHGFRVSQAGDGALMRKMLANAPIDLIVLDLTLPREDGLSLTREIRAESQTPIIMLTARGDPIDRVIGLELGADDYLAKPFEPRELVARIKSVLRRAAALPPNLEPISARRFRFAGWSLDLEARRLERPDGAIVMLSGAEFQLLKVFAEHPNRVLSRDQLMTLAKGREAEAFDRAIDLQVSRLREKLGDDARNPELIKTVRNEGYVLAARVERDSAL